MTTGNIFTLMINDGKQDALLNATQYLQKRIDDIYNTRIQNCMKDMQKYFNNPSNFYKQNFNEEKQKWLDEPVDYCSNHTQAVHQTMIEISKTHKIYVGSCFKPFVAMAYSYIKINEKEGSQTFGNEITYIIPQYGTWIQDMVLHIRLTGLHAMSSVDKVKYCSLLGHRLMEKVTFQINNGTIAEYTSELYNKHYQFHVPTNKKQGWLRNVGHEIPNLAYMTPDPSSNEFREYRWFGDGPQTFKNKHDSIDMYIPLLFWFNLDIAQAFPNIKIPKGSVKVKIKFADLSKIVASADYGGGGAYQAPLISTADLYVNHISTLPELEQILLQDYDFNLIRIHKIYEKTLNNSDSDILLKELKFPVEHIAIAFRPEVNYSDIDNWYRSTVLTPVDLLVPAAVMDNTQIPPAPSLAINSATYYTETPSIDRCGLKIKDIEIFQNDTVNKFSSFYPYTAIGLNTPEDQGWLLFNMQFRPDSYDPSGHIDMSRNREVYLNYSSSYVNDLHRTRLIVIAQTINFLVVRNNSAYLRYL